MGKSIPDVKNRRCGMVKALVCSTCCCLFVTFVHSQTALADEVGKRLYNNYCAKCHGKYGDGNSSGAVSGPRLTNLARNNGGVFPMDQVVRIIDGEDQYRAHGSPMPMWGNKLDRLFGLGPEETEAEADGWIRSLARYVGELQR